MIPELKVKLTEVIAPSFYDVHRAIKAGKFDEYVFKGGRGSTKSTNISVEIILGMIQDPAANAIVFRRYQNELRDSVVGQFEWTILKLGLEHLFLVQISPMQVIYLPTGQRIIFRGADKPKKMKSINLGKGYIKYAWFEELDQFGGPDEIRNILQSMFRGGNEKRVVFFSYNPPKSSRSWVNREAKIPKPGKFVHHSSYLDVPKDWLGERFLTDAEHLKRTNEMAYRHEYLGEEVGTGLEVFTNVELRTITDQEIARFDKLYQGLDFGYAISPLAFERMHFDSTRRRLYIFAEVAGLNLFNNVFWMKAKKYNNVLTIADSEDPKSIGELRSFGMNIRGAKKGPGSVEFGIKFLQGLEKIIIDPERCPLSAREFINYTLEVDKLGNVKDKFPDKDNHSIDAIRYALEDAMAGVNTIGIEVLRGAKVYG
ncbi:MAG: Phage terminase large subunit [Spirochaetes bacterium ADurb.Bin001]|nr:MAG: Phage terminase large subunit [Spirochaetes bacterium ADurb.Bin001]